MNMKFFIFIMFVISTLAWGRIPQSYKSKNITYRTYFNQCPDRSSSDLVVQLMKVFEKNRSLKEVKDKIVEEKWAEKYFLNDYKIHFHPIKKQLIVQLHCPQPLARVKVYRENGKEHYSATLAEGGKLFDPSYEVLMKNEKKINSDLPSLVMSVELIEKEEHVKIADTLTLFKNHLKKRMSEIIFNERHELTLILNNGLTTTSIFLGTDLWEHKLGKLEKIIQYMDRSHRSPSSINLVHSKKVVVKF
jgi:hypothetical protein